MTSVIDERGEQTADRVARRFASLASTDQIDPAVRPLSCPYAADRVVIDLIQGSVYPDRCRSSQCLYCLPLNARRRCLAITLAEPQRMVRLSLLAESSDGDPCSTALRRVGRIRRNLKRMGYDAGEWSFTIEKNPKGTGYHAHCLQRGSSIPQAILQKACKRARAGYPWIKAIRRKGIWTSQYGLKGFGADGYGLKTFRPGFGMSEALRINHGRVEHHSRKFFEWDGMTMRVRDMERAAIAEMNGNHETAFIGCHPSEAQHILANDELRSKLISDIRTRNAGKLRALM